MFGLSSGGRVWRFLCAVVVMTAVLVLGGPLVGVGGAATFSVTSTADSGAGSLRQAILDANAAAGADTISFAIPGSGMQTVAVTSGALPVITDPVVIDGRSQPGYAGSPLIRVDNGTGASVTGLDVSGGSSQLLGLAITGFNTGIRLAIGGSNRVAADWVGLAGAGVPAGNTTGILIRTGSSGNTIGGTSVSDRNVISGNATGVLVSGGGVNGNVIAGNYVGPDVTGGPAVVSGIGIKIQGGASGNTIGGAVSGARNLISRNANYGVGLFGSGTTTNLVEGNYVGVDPAGSAAAANGKGVIVSGAGGNTIGGTSGEARNVVSGNSSNGVQLTGSGATGNVVAGNYVGTTASGNGAVANGTGVRVDASANGNTIGGTTASARNVVSGNTGYGVELAAVGTTGNVVEGNYVGTSSDGAAPLPNGTGVRIEAGAGANTIGGTTSSARNVISGNSSYGVLLTGSATSGNLVEGNRIGTNPKGTVALANATGVRLDGGASGNTIGGTTGGARNVISGNTAVGVEITVSGTAGNLVQGNYIGTNAGGSGALANDIGVLVSADGNTVGGATSGARNLISGNTSVGVELLGGRPRTGNTVAGNYIGTNAAATAAIANAIGVLVQDSDTNTIGGTTGAARNVISGNTTDGVQLAGVDAIGNVVEGNRIGTNAAGDAALAHATGVRLENGANGNTIGGATSAARNLISGNAIGVDIQGGGTTGNVVAANYIGTNATGTVALGNGAGVLLESGASGNTVGGATSGARNVISGNFRGVQLSGLGTASNTIEGNYIGTDAAGAAALYNPTGVQLDSGANGNTIGGTSAGARNVISGNGSGVLFGSNPGGAAGGTANVVAGNYIGTNAAGTAAVANDIGVDFEGASSGNTIGGSVKAARNLISGNNFAGVYFFDSQETGNTVAGNYIGTNAAGSAALGNAHYGIAVEAAGGNTIGGTTSAARNVISGNTDFGVAIFGPDTTGTLVEGNYIGTNAAGTSAVANGAGVVELGGDNQIGGTSSGARNVISGNTYYGVQLLDTGATGNLVEGNYIGTSFDGTAALGNGAAGVEIERGASGNTVGGTAAGAGNTIAFNGGAGVSVYATATVTNGISIEGNWIDGNTGLGIDLVSGANDAQAAPWITDIIPEATDVVDVSGSLLSTPSSSFRIEVFASPSCDASGAGEGKRFVAATSTTTDGFGGAGWFVQGVTIHGGEAVTATATDTTTGDTSEFSSCFTSP